MLTSTQFCNYCGAAYKPQAKFCVVCGRPHTLVTEQGGGSTPGLPGVQGLLKPEPVKGPIKDVPTATGLTGTQGLLKQRYRILRQLGVGGFGAVYQAEDTHLGDALRAIKELIQDELNAQKLQEEVETFKHEAVLLAGLMHQNLPRIYDHFSDSGRWYLVMDYIEGRTLEEWLSKATSGKLPIEEVLDIGIQLCTVLDYLHTQQPPINFRDLKPANVMMTANKHLYLIDFGIARHFKLGQTKDTVALGTIGYAAPEQFARAQKQTTPSADIYSLGVIFHQLLSGNDPSENPFQFAPLAPGGQPAHSSLETLVMHMVEKDRDKRPTSMIVVKQELQRIARQLKADLSSVSVKASHATPPTTPSTKELWTREASALFKHKRYQEALEVYEQIIRLDPTDALAYSNKGDALYNLKRYQEAAVAYEQTIRLDPNNARANYDKGDALFKLTRYQEALIAYEQAIRLDPTNALAYSSKGDALYNLTRYQEAAVAFEQVIRLDPTNARAYSNKGDMLSDLKRYQEAAVAYEQVIRLDPTNARTYHNKGLALFKLTCYQEALIAFEQAIRFDPVYALAYRNKGAALFNLGQHREATIAYNQAARLGYRN